MDKKLLGGIGGGLGVVALTVATFFAVTGGVLPSPTPTPTAVSVYEINGLADAPPKPTPTPTPAPVAEVITEAPAPTGPTLCPEGTVAGAIDDAGNESACYETNDEGQQCVAYDADNNCTQYYKP